MLTQVLRINYVKLSLVIWWRDMLSLALFDYDVTWRRFSKESKVIIQAQY